MLRPGLRGIHAPWTIDNTLREDASSLPAVPGKEPRWAGPHPRLSFDRRPTASVGSGTFVSGDSDSWQ